MLGNGRSRLVGMLRSGFWKFFSGRPRIARLLLSHRILRVSSSPQDFSFARKLVYKSSPAQVCLDVPILDASKSDSASDTYKPLHVHSFAGAGVVNNARFNSLVVGSNLVLESRREDGPWYLYKGKRPRRVGLINGQHIDLVAMQDVGVSENFPVGAYIGTRAPYNWYHWIANLLPTLHVLNQSGVPNHVPLVLPDEVRQIPQMMESLEFFRRGRQIIWIEKHQFFQFDVLYWAESPVYDAPFSRDASYRLPLILHAEAMDGYREEVLAYCSSFNSTCRASNGEKIFLGRRPGSSRPYNGPAVEGWAAEAGFRVVFPEEMSFVNQVHMFATATHIIGPTGAALANVIFSSAALKILRLRGSTAPYENYFSNLATVSGAAIYNLECSVTDYSNGAGGFLVEKGPFREALSLLVGSD